MKGTVNLIALNAEVFTDSVEGFGNFSGYLDLRGLQAGHIVSIRQLIDVDGVDDNVSFGAATVSYDDLIDAGSEGGVEIPFTLEALQTGKIGVKVIQGAVPLVIPFRLTNIQTGA